MHAHISTKSFFLRVPKWEVLNIHSDFYLSSGYSNFSFVSRPPISIWSYSVTYPVYLTTV